MAREYGKVAATFWTGETGRAIRSRGGDAQRVALYAMTCPSSSMTGLYYLPIAVICHEVGIDHEGALKALRSLFEVGFARYDEPSEHIFVPEMAAYQIGEPLAASDNRVKAVHKEWLTMRKSPFFLDFHQRYRASYHLPDPAKFASPSQAPSKALRSQEQEQGHEQEQEQEQAHEHEQGQEQEGAARRPCPSIDEVKEFFREQNAPDGWAENFFDHFEGSGWLDKNSRPLASWKNRAKRWIREDREKLDKKLGPGQQHKSNGAGRW